MEIMLKLDKRKIEVIENNDFQKEIDEYINIFEEIHKKKPNPLEQKEIKEDIIDTTKPSSTQIIIEKIFDKINYVLKDLNIIIKLYQEKK